MRGWQRTGAFSARIHRLLVAPALFAGAGCMSMQHIAGEQAATPVFDAAAFFDGATEGKGVLKVRFRAPQRVLIEGSGRIQPDGSIILDQSVRRGDRVATHRQWHLSRDGAGGYVGTLSDASGPVHATSDGNRLHIRFALKHGLKAEQWLTLDHAGTVSHNVLIVRMRGIAVARLDETITRVAR